MKFNHVNLVVSDPEASADFYRMLLADDADAVWLEESLHLRDGQNIDFAFQKGVPVVSLGGHIGFLAESAASIQHLLIQLQNADVSITDDCTEEGFRSIKFLDPDGYEVEVYWERDWP